MKGGSLFVRVANLRCSFVAIEGGEDRLEINDDLLERLGCCLLEHAGGGFVCFSCHREFLCLAADDNHRDIVVPSDREQCMTLVCAAAPFEAEVKEHDLGSFFVEQDSCQEEVRYPDELLVRELELERVHQWLAIEPIVVDDQNFLHRIPPRVLPGTVRYFSSAVNSIQSVYFSVPYNGMVYSVSQFNALISDYLSEGLGSVSVRGEIIDLKIAKDRLVFFDLKDPYARVGCFMMKWELPAGIEEGMEVEVDARAGLFKQSGRFHLRVVTITPVGDGAIAKALRVLKEKLEREGLFAPERKRPLPRFPQTIGVVTSPDAAAFTDVLRILNNRWGNVSVVLSPTSVQGNTAVSEIVEAFARLNTRDDIDVVILTRGGGAIEELQAFNSEAVARAIFGSRHPVMSAVGHERDTTIADLVADVRASTPSNAAERVVDDRREVMAMIDRSVEGIAQVMLRRIGDSCSTVDAFVRSGEFWFAGLVDRLEHAQAMLRSLSPASTLERGYSITKDDAGHIVRRRDSVGAGAHLTTIVSDGQIQSEVVK